MNAASTINYVHLRMARGRTVPKSEEWTQIGSRQERQVTWNLQWHANCDDLTPFRAIQVAKDTTDRLISWPVQPAKNGNALRAEVLQGDFAWNPHANGGQGKEIAGGWRAEVVGLEEAESNDAVRYEWSTMLDSNYATNPLMTSGKPPFQVITQWHQGDDNQGGSPPVALIILGDQILLDVQKAVSDTASKQVGQWPIAPQLNRGSWHDFAAEIKWHSTAGTIKFWYGGQPVTFKPVQSEAFGGTFPAQDTDTLSVATLFPALTTKPTAPSCVYFKAGLYRRAANTTPAQTFVLYHDEISRYTWSP